MPRTRLPHLSVIGAGVVGSTLTTALFHKGYPIASIISRTGRRAIALAKTVRCKQASTQIADVSAQTEVLLITVGDDALMEVAEQVARVRTLKFKRLFVAHCSGAHSTDILAPIQRRGALVSSIHPVQTFPSAASPTQLRTKLRGIYYGIEGSDAALKRAAELVQSLDGHPLVITSEMRPLYHIACVFASNYLMILLNTVSEISRTLGIKASWTEAFGPLMTTTMENIVRFSAASALTGPIVRGDVTTVNLHLDSLSRHAPQYLPLYTVGGIEIARIARQHGRISDDQFTDLVSRFRSFVKSHSLTQRAKGRR